MRNNCYKLAWFIALVTISVFVTHSLAASLDTPKVTGDAEINSHFHVPQSSQNIELLSHLGGSILAVATQNNLIYAGFNGDFSILDPSIPGSPQKIGSTILPGAIQDITLIGNFAFTANGSGGMSIVDISDPTHPTELSSLDTPGDGYAIAVGTGCVYVADGLQGVRVIDISNMYAPFEANSIPAPNPARDVLVSGNTLYLADDTAGLYIYDLSDPLNPTYVTHVPTPGTAQNITIVSHYLFLAASYQGLRIMDINNPTSPVEISYVENIGYIYNVSVFWPYAYVSDWYDGSLYIIDISNLTSPSVVGQFHSYEIVNGLFGVAVVGNQAFVSMAERGLYTLDVSNPSNPSQLGIYNPFGTLFALSMWQNTLYVANNSIVAIDITNPISPVLLGTGHGTGRAHSVGSSAGYTYSDDSSWWPSHLNVMDFTNPYAPVLVNTIETNQPMNEMKIVGGYGYLGDHDLQILDLSNPASPVVIGNYASAYNPVYGLDIQGDYVYLAAGQNLIIINVIDKSNPYSVGMLGLAYAVYGIDVEGNYVYAAWSNYNYEGGGFSIIDVSNPSAPVEVSRTLTTWGAHGIAVENNVLYIGVRNQGVLMYNVLDKTSPTQIGHYERSFGGDLLVNDGIIYVSAETGGLFILGSTIQRASISGIVQGPNNAPIQGVTINTQYESVTTDQNGAYQFPDQLPGTYTLTPIDPTGVFIPSSRTVTLPPNGSGQNFHLLPGSVSADLTPGITTILSYTDLQGMLTQLIFPAGAVSETVNATIEPILPPHFVGFSYTGHTFDLIIAHDDLPIPGFTFNAQVAVSIQYTDYDIGAVIDEEALAVLWILDNVWQDSTLSCLPPTGYARDPSGNQISVPICRSGVFTLMGPTLPSFLPMLFVYHP
jgi:hypothetical protein